MIKANLEDVTLDEEDAALFALEGDYLLKAKAIQNSIHPKLNVLMEEAISRIRKIYGIEVFNQNSIITYSPHFREYRKSDLKINYTHAFWALGGSRLPIWKKFERTDNKPTQIIPYKFGFEFSDNGLSLFFNPSSLNKKFIKESNEIFLKFLLDNIEYIQTILSYSKMCPCIYAFDNMILPFREIISNHIKEQLYDIPFLRLIKCPINYDELNSLIQSFVIFFPVYYSLLEIAQNKEYSFKNIISKLNFKNLFEEYPAIEKEKLLVTNKKINIVIDENKFVKAGMRWQIFERDEFKCVACGKSAHDGAILHIDHIKPKSKGGANNMDNYQTLCHLCNIGKSNKSEIDLRKA
jgi:hypothetical protein